MNWLQRQIERLIRHGAIPPYEAALYHLFGAELALWCPASGSADAGRGVLLLSALEDPTCDLGDWRHV